MSKKNHRARLQRAFKKKLRRQKRRRTMRVQGRRRSAKLVSAISALAAAAIFL